MQAHYFGWLCQSAKGHLDPGGRLELHSRRTGAVRLVRGNRWQHPGARRDLHKLRRTGEDAGLLRGQGWLHKPIRGDSRRHRSLGCPYGLGSAGECQTIAGGKKISSAAKSLPTPPHAEKAPDPLSKRSKQREEWNQLHGGKVAKAIEAAERRVKERKEERTKTRQLRRAGKAPPRSITLPTAARDALDYDFEGYEDEPEDCRDQEDQERLPEDEPLSNEDEGEGSPKSKVEAVAEGNAADGNDPQEPEGEPSPTLSGESLDTMWKWTKNDTPRALVPSYVINSSAYQADAQASRATGQAFAEWAAKMEGYYCTMYEIPPMERRAFCGRGALKELKLTSPKAEPMEDTVVSGTGDWWSGATRNLRLLARMKAGKKATPDTIKQQEQKLAKIATNLTAGQDPPLAAEDLESWKKALKNLEKMDVKQVKDLADTADDNKKKADSSRMRQSIEGFVAWYDSAIAKGYGGIHAATKDRRADPDEYIVTSRSGSWATTSPKELLDQKREVWASKWKHEDTFPQEFWSLLEEAKTRARAESATRKPISLDSLDKVLRLEPTGKSDGLAMISVHDVKRLPNAGRRELLQLYAMVEERLAWPWQLQAIAVALIPKKGGDRGLGVMSWIVRLWSRLRSDTIGVWSEETSDPWDQAVPGSSSLRAAMSRAFMDETACTLGLETASTLWDIQEFFDSLDLTKILLFAKEFEFPATELVLLISCHLAARLLRSKGCYAEAIQPHRSAVAGCRGAQQFARMVMKKIMVIVYWKHVPAVIASTWIDDVNQRAEATRNLVKRYLVAAAVEFAAAVQGVGLTLASKSRVIASSRGLDGEIAEEIREHGYAIEAAEVAPDLGVDRGSKVKSSKPTFRERRSKAIKRAKIATSLSKTAGRWKAGRHVFQTGILPQFAYGPKVYGMAPTPLMHTRTSAGAATAPKKAGRCLTTLLALRKSSDDPGISIPMGLVREWLSLLASSEAVRHRASKTWRSMVKFMKARPKSRWRHIGGPAAAVIATLLDAGWNPSSYHKWKDPQGGPWATCRFEDENLDLDPSDLLAKIFDTLSSKIWEKASKHYNAKGMEKGVDMTGLKKHIARLRRQKKFEELGALESAVTATTWTRGKIAAHKKEEVPIDETLCQRCHKAIETDYHRIWVCEANDKLRGCKHSKYLIKRARIGAEKYPCLWLRGLVPADWTAVAPPPDQTEAETHNERMQTDSEGKFFSPSGHRILGCGDGSGGRKTSDRRLRRAAWAWVILDGDKDQAKDVACSRAAALPGRRQTVNRCELSSFLNFMDSTAGEVEFVTDSAYVVKGTAKIRSAHRTGKEPIFKSNIDLWRKAVKLLDERSFELHKVESHLKIEEEDSWKGRYPKAWVVGNSCADALAGVTAESAAVPSSSESALEWVDDIATVIQQRLYSTLLDAVQKDPRAPQPPKPKAQKENRLKRTKEKKRKRTLLEASTTHELERNKGALRCRRCGSAPVAKGEDAWLKTRCLEVVSTPFCPEFQRASPTEQITIGTAGIHQSHKANRNEELQVWFCSTCGKTGAEVLRDLAKECPLVLNKAGAQNLSRIRKGLKPGESSAAKAYNALKAAAQPKRLKKQKAKAKAKAKTSFQKPRILPEDSSSEEPEETADAEPPQEEPKEAPQTTSEVACPEAASSTDPRGSTAAAPRRPARRVQRCVAPRPPNKEREERVNKFAEVAAQRSAEEAASRAATEAAAAEAAAIEESAAAAAAAPENEEGEAAAAAAPKEDAATVADQNLLQMYQKLNCDLPRSPRGCLGEVPIQFGAQDPRETVSLDVPAEGPCRDEECAAPAAAPKEDAAAVEETPVMAPLPDPVYSPTSPAPLSEPATEDEEDGVTEPETEEPTSPYNNDNIVPIEEEWAQNFVAYQEANAGAAVPTASAEVSDSERCEEPKTDLNSDVLQDMLDLEEIGDKVSWPQNLNAREAAIVLRARRARDTAAGSLGPLVPAPERQSGGSEASASSASSLFR